MDRVSKETRPWESGALGGCQGRAPAAKAVPLPRPGAAREPGKAGHGGRAPRQISDRPGILDALLLAPAVLAPGPRHSLQGCASEPGRRWLPGQLPAFPGAVCTALFAGAGSEHTDLRQAAF